MARPASSPDPAARLSALLGTPVGHPYPVGRPEPLPAVFRPALPRRDPAPVAAARPTRSAAVSSAVRPWGSVDPPTLPLVVDGVLAGRAGVGATPPGTGPGEDGPIDWWGEADGISSEQTGADDGTEVDDRRQAGHAPGSRPSRLARTGARWLPAGWRGARLDPGRAGAIALVLVAAVAAVVAAIGVWADRPQAEQLPALPAVTLGDPAAPEAGTSTSAGRPPGDPARSDAVPVDVVVSVSGKVARPGLVHVPEGARVADVLAAAGGADPGTDLTTLNLARRVTDGEQVAVGVPAAPDAAAAPAGGTGTGGAGGKIDLNSATVEQLDGLPGVGPVTAQRIVDWRTRNGRFARVDQLREVEGIGERRFAQLRESVTA